MLQNKDIDKLSELKNGLTPLWFDGDFIKSSLKCFSLSSLSKPFHSIKTKGYSFLDILTSLILLPYYGCDTIYAYTNSKFLDYFNAGKDVFYRFKNNGNICWRSMQWLLTNKYYKRIEQEGVDNSLEPKCLIFDDTLIEKTGASIENVSRVWDHVSNRYVLGFKMLLMAYWDGVNSIPLDFSLHREKGKRADRPYGLKKKELKAQYKKQREKSMPSFTRSDETNHKKTSVVIEMIKRAVLQNIKIDYVLVDSWFTCWDLLSTVLEETNGSHLIGMYKIVKSKFSYKGEMLTYKQINNNLGKPKRCRKLKLYYKEATVNLNDKTIKLFFSKQGKNGKWKVFVCTDTKLSFIQAIKIYQIRWSIEVLFKESKQLLKLGKSQSQDFDAQIADITLTMIQYTLLTLRFRFDKYETKGPLFKDIKDDIIEHKLNERIWGLFIELVSIVLELFDEVDTEKLFKKIIENEKLANTFFKMTG